ncbi:MAG: AIR synthase-related protein [Candidatus Lokiarchaeota archaeon]
MLEEIAESIRTNKNIIEKKEISPIVQFININTYKSPRIYSDLGEDSAAINDHDKFILITTDRINTYFLKSFPFGAGFSSILVGVDDIFCCGGTPLAASLILSYIDAEIGQDIINGICEVGKASKLYWDTVTFKTSEQVLYKRRAMTQIAHHHIANASKDISNAGIFGSILQIVKYSSVGADIDLDSIQIPPKLRAQDYSLEHYSKMYLTTSFVLTAPFENCDEMIEIFSSYGLKAKIIGKIIKAPVLKIHDKNSSIEVVKY